MTNARGAGRVVRALVVAVVAASVVGAAPVVPVVAGAVAPPGVGQPSAAAEVLAASVSWPDPGGSGVTGYRIAVSPGGAVVDVPVAVTSWVVQGLTAGTPYTFRVRAVTAEGDGALSPASAAVVPEAPGGAFRPVLPDRILDTRKAIGAPDAPVGAKASLTVDVTGVGGVPASGVEAVVVNVTAVGATAPTHLTLFPSGTIRPAASSLNVSGGDAVPNLVEVKVGAGGAVDVFNNAGSVDVIFDVAGYVLAPDASIGSEGLYTPLAPTRILDTRKGVGAPMAPVGEGGTVDLQVTGQGGVPATGVGAVVLNVTATNASAATFVTAFPAGAARPATSNLNVSAGQTVPNRVIVKVGAGGRVTLFNRSGTVDLLADVSGWYAAAGGAATGAAFTATDPARVLDTRKGIGGPTAPIVAGVPRRVQITGAGGVPSMDEPVPPTAVVANITVTGPTTASFAVAWPHGTPKPLASDLNFTAGQTVPNLAVVKLGGDGAIDLGVGLGSADVIVDVLGWYAGDQATAWNLEVVSAASILSAPAGSITFAAPAPALDVGDLVAAAIGPATPGGLLRRVTAVGGTTVSTVDAELTEAIVNGQLSTGPADAAAPPTLGPAGAPAGSGEAFLGTELSNTMTLPGSGIGLSGSLTTKFKIGVDINVASDDTGYHVTADAGVSTKSTLAATVGVDLAGAYSQTITLPSSVSTPILFFVGAVPFVARMRIDPSVVVAVTGKVKLGSTVTMSRTYGANMKYANGVLTPITTTSSEPPTYTPVTLTGSADLKASIKVPVGLEINGIATIKAGFAPYLRAHVDQCGGQTYVGVDALLGFRLGLPTGDPTFEWETTPQLWEAQLTNTPTNVCVNWSGVITLTTTLVRVLGNDVITDHRTFTFQLNGAACVPLSTNKSCPSTLIGSTSGTERGSTDTFCGDPPQPTTLHRNRDWGSTALTFPDGATVDFTDVTTAGGRTFGFSFYDGSGSFTYPVTGTQETCDKTIDISSTERFEYAGTYPQLFPRVPLGPTDPLPTTLSGGREWTDAANGFVGNVTYQLTSLPDADHNGVPD